MEGSGSELVNKKRFRITNKGSGIGTREKINVQESEL